MKKKLRDVIQHVNQNNDKRIYSVTLTGFEIVSLVRRASFGV